MAPIPQAPISAAWAASFALSRRQQLPTCTITLNLVGTEAIHFSANAIRSSAVSM